MHSAHPAKPLHADLGDLLGSLDAAAADAELLEQIRPVFELNEGQRIAAILAAVGAKQGWSRIAWWTRRADRVRIEEQVGAERRLPDPRPAVGPLGRALTHGIESVASADEQADCPRVRSAAREGARWALALPVEAMGAAGILELIGTPDGGLGPERVALLRHVAWLVALCAATASNRNATTFVAPVVPGNQQDQSNDFGAALFARAA